MPLPKTKHPKYTFEIPSTKKKASFRPFLVKEEKLLLMAKSSGQTQDIFLAIQQILNLCCLDAGFSVEKLTLFDMEYLFLKLHAVSVTNVIEVSYIDNEDKTMYNFKIDLNEVKMKWPENRDVKIETGTKTGLIMKYPSASLYTDTEFLSNTKDSLFNLIVRCIESVYTETEMFPASDFTIEEVAEYVDDLDVKTFEKLTAFMLNQPTMYYKIEYKNSMGNDRAIELSTLSDFFVLA